MLKENALFSSNVHSILTNLTHLKDLMSAPEPLSKISCTVNQKIGTGHFQQEFISRTIYKIFWPGDGLIAPLLLQRVLEPHNFWDATRHSSINLDLKNEPTTFGH